MTYRVREIFDTLQGEGSRAGTRAVFVRFTGCNLWNGLADGRAKGKGACAAWCDTDFASGDKMTAEQILAACDAIWAPETGDDRWLVLTGGEPMLQVDAPLLHLLRAAGWLVAMETNGTIDPIHGVLLDLVDHLCVSPKRGGTLVRAQADDLKIVVPGGGGEHRPWDVEAIRALEKAGTWGQVFIQPEDGPDGENNTQIAIDLVHRNPRWRLSVQVHKMVGLP